MQVSRKSLARRDELPWGTAGLVQRTAAHASLLKLLRSTVLLSFYRFSLLALERSSQALDDQRKPVDLEAIADVDGRHDDGKESGRRLAHPDVPARPHGYQLEALF